MKSQVQNETMVQNQAKDQHVLPNQTMVQMQWVGCPEQPILACNVMMGPGSGMQAMPGMPQAQLVQQLPQNQHASPDQQQIDAPQQVILQDLPEQWQQALQQAVQQSQSRQQVKGPVDQRVFPAHQQKQAMWERDFRRMGLGDHEVSGDRMRWGDDENNWRGHAATQQAMRGTMHHEMVRTPPLENNTVGTMPKPLIGGQRSGQWSDAKQRGRSGPIPPFNGMERPHFQQDRSRLPLHLKQVLTPSDPQNKSMFFPPPEQQPSWDATSGGRRPEAFEHRNSRSRDGGNWNARPSRSGPAALLGATGAAPLDTMKVQLQALQNEDPNTVFIARRINKLGFSSSIALREHFSTYGEVAHIHVSHSRVKNLRPGSNRNTETQWRLRPASLGFVVMASPEVTARILEDGPEHDVKGVTVRTQPFHHQAPDVHHSNQEAIGAYEPEETQAAEEDDYVAWAKGQPRSLSPGSDSFDTGTFDRFESGDSTSTTATSVQEFARCQRVEGATMCLQSSQPKVSAQVAANVEKEMEMLYNNFVMSEGPIVHTSSQ